MAAISQMTFSSAFAWMKMYDSLLKFHWDMFLCLVINILSFFQISHFLNQWWLLYWWKNCQVSIYAKSLHWCHNEHDCVSNHQPHDCLINRLFKHRWKKTLKLRATGLCEGNSPVTGEFPTQRTSNAEYVSIWWRHHVNISACNRHTSQYTNISVPIDDLIR